MKNGQLEMINGGWCMHDEAGTHFVDMIDQTTYGHRFIKEQFGVAPKVGWQQTPSVIAPHKQHYYQEK